MDVVNRYVVYELDYVMGNESCKLLKRVEFKGWLVSNCFNTEEDAIQALIDDKKFYQKYVILKQIFIRNL